MVTLTMSCLTMKVGGNRILQLLQGINDLVEACVNFHHFDIQSWLTVHWRLLEFQRNQDIWPPFMRVLVTPAVHPRVFKILTSLTFGVLRKNHFVSPTFEDITKTKNKKQ